MGNRPTKEQVNNNVNDIFSKNPSPEQIKKIKKVAMSKNIKLGGLRKRFCKKCFSLSHSANSEIRIKNKLKIIRCKNCGYVTRYKLKD